MDEASDQPGGGARGFGFGDDAPDALRRVALTGAGFVVGGRRRGGKGFEEVSPLPRGEGSLSKQNQARGSLKRLFGRRSKARRSDQVRLAGRLRA